MSHPAPHVYEAPIPACPRCRSRETLRFRAVTRAPHAVFALGCKACGFWSIHSEHMDKVVYRWNQRQGGKHLMGVCCLFCGALTQREAGAGHGVHCANCGATLDPAEARDFES